MTQEQALDILKLGHNVFLTGLAGSGKTHVLQQYLAYLKEKEVVVGITASTGVAATQIGGITINSWAGIGIKQQLSENEIVSLLKRSYLRKRFQRTQVLVIDEVSMLSAYTFELVNKLCKEANATQLPFGGMQVILCGDFFQLPPVTKVQNSEFGIENQINIILEEDDTRPIEFHRLDSIGTPHEHFPLRSSTLQDDTKFIYSTNSWNELDITVCYLDQVFRQEDQEFLQILNEIRGNHVEKPAIKTLASRLYKDIGEVLTRLYTHTVNVDWINTRELLKLPGEMHTFDMSGKGNEYLVSSLKKTCLAPEKLFLKEGAVVMFVKNNFEKGYVNGTLGTVVGFSNNDHPMVEIHSGGVVTVTPAEWGIEEDGEVKAKVIQLPLRLAWAITIHKSQGMSLDAAEIDLGRPFAPGMGYVALSRVRSLKGVKLMGLNHKALEVNKHVVQFDKKLQEASRGSAGELGELSWMDTQILQMSHLHTLQDANKSSSLFPQRTYRSLYKTDKC